MVTKVGLSPPRLPPGESRVRLYRLAERGMRLCGGIDSRGARLVTYLCDMLARALVTAVAAESRAQSAERLLERARLRITELERQLRAEAFDEPTAVKATPDLVEREREVTRRLRRSAAP